MPFSTGKKHPPKLSARGSDINQTMGPAHRWGLDLTPRQQAVWEWMICFQRTHFAPPSMREICRQFRFSSTHAVTGYMRALIRKGKVMHVGEDSRSRAYVAIFDDDRCPCCGRKPMAGTNLARRIHAPDPADEPSSPTAETVPSVSPRDVIAARRAAGLPVPGEDFERVEGL